ncbi:ChrR family anti-sigma-E factor [Pseudidiomarina donghaiensis]|uniref:Transcriptional regulator n=1 Tax=Pseudidiomarina donghaiensis TaxID=519452 RepID=A0A432XBU7_9GAMM|nr:ChrR family anti-sigma-E factor [Pseudidiomarina donghaiensis]RUO46228.1 transcriptional regulator [Pseudidiomarina donghaiensis]SFV24851.1 anti-ECFsigma factor, ChrR [Pseudidiomarina donghaiensis]
MIKFHPSEQHLVLYTAGELSPAMLMMVGTHVDMCSHCQAHVRDIEQQLARKLFGDVEKQPVERNSSLDEQAMLQAIFNSQPATETGVVAANDSLYLEGNHFKLPATLARNSHRIGDWSRLPGKLWRAPVTVGGEEMLNFIYMAENASLPEHTHKGNEATLVVNGVFNDENNEYRDGDFVLLDNHHKHSPATQNEDCLTLAALEGPLHFTSGLSRLLNPFSSLFFK